MWISVVTEFGNKPYLCSEQLHAPQFHECLAFTFTKSLLTVWKINKNGETNLRLSQFG
jgi:hypothetical protein